MRTSTWRKLMALLAPGDLWTRTSLYQIDREDAKAGKLAAIGAAVTTAVGILNQLKIFEPAGVGRFAFAAAAFCVAMAIALLARNWLLPSPTSNVPDEPTDPKAAGVAESRDKYDRLMYQYLTRAKGAKWASVFATLALLFAGITPLLSVGWPETGAGFLGRRLTVGYAQVPEHPDTLVITAAGKVDPSASVILTLSPALTSGVSQEAPSFPTEVIASWGFAVPASGEVAVEVRRSVSDRMGSALTLQAWTSQSGRRRQVAREKIELRGPGT